LGTSFGHLASVAAGGGPQYQSFVPTGIGPEAPFTYGQTRLQPFTWH
jgi:hypothetical protein